MTETHIKSNDFIKNLKFDHFTTYSFHRTKEFLNLIEAAKKDFQKTGDESSINCINLRRHPTRLTSADNQFNPTAEKIRTIKFSDDESAQLISILSTPANDTAPWLCKPVYRDGIVFYDHQNKIVSVLNICLECEYMQLDNEVYVDTNTESYKLMRDFLKQLGHPI